MGVKDYSTYHPSFEDKMLNDGRKMFDIAKNGVDGFSVIVDNVTKQVVISDKYNNPDGSLKYIMADVGVLKLGSVVKYQDNSWIVVELTKDNPVYQTAIMQLCNQTLKWQLPSFSLYSFPCIAQSKFLSLDTNKYITLPDGTVQVIVSATTETKGIVIDQRFILGSQVYVVQGIDDLKSGILTFKLGLTQKNDKDNFILKLADNSHLTQTSGGSWL